MFGSMHIEVPHTLPEGGWGIWICIDPTIEFFYCSVGDGELGYVLIQTLSVSIARSGDGELGYV
jgi:hypothetical protein